MRRLLPALGYSRQSNRKADEGSKHPDRDAQFEHINAKVIAARAADQPVISVDTKKKELIGNYRNGGTDYRPKGDPRRVKVHDFEEGPRPPPRRAARPPCDSCWRASVQDCPLSSRDPTLIDDLRRIVEPATLGCPVRPLLWVSKSHDKLAVALQRMGHRISANSVRRLLPALGYSRQSNRKADEGSKHPDRDAQFEHINAKVIAARAADQPVISVDTKKKELIGNYRNGGTDYRPKGDPRRVKVQGAGGGMGRTGGGLRDHGSGALDHRPRPEGSRRCATAERPGSPPGRRPASFVEPGPNADR